MDWCELTIEVLEPYPAATPNEVHRSLCSTPASLVLQAAKIHTVSPPFKINIVKVHVNSPVVLW